MALRNPYAVIANIKDRGVGNGQWGMVILLVSLSHYPIVFRSIFPSDLDPLQRLVVIFDRIDDQVVEDFADTRVVGSNDRKSPRATDLGAAFLQPRRDHLQRSADDFVEIDFTQGQFGLPDAREMEQGIDKGLHSLRQVDYGLKLLHAGFVQFVGVIFHQEIGISVNAAQRLLQVVRRYTSEG